MTATEFVNTSNSIDMYINFEMLSSRGLTINNLVLLQMCKQNKFEDLSTYIENIFGDLDFQFLEERELIEYVKPKKKDNTKYQLARISKKGNELLSDLETPEITEEDLTVWAWLADAYKKAGKQIGNIKKGKLWLAEFRVQSGITRNHLVKLCNEFLYDEKCQEYSFRLDYVFFRPTNVFTTRFDLNESKLWQYYLSREEYFINLFTITKN